MTVERIGHGAGRREFVEQPNLLRLFVGQAPACPRLAAGWKPAHGERPGLGAGDQPRRPAGRGDRLLLRPAPGRGRARRVQHADPHEEEPARRAAERAGAGIEPLPALEEILFRETTTLGIRRYPVSRHKLNRRPCTVKTPWGPVQGKLGWLDGRPPGLRPEYEDCAASPGSTASRSRSLRRGGKPRTCHPWIRGAPIEGGTP